MTSEVKASTTSWAVQVDDVAVSYRDVLALEHASLHVAAGQVCGLVGMNGSGKSTLLRVIAGVVTPNSGDVRLFDSPVSEALRAARVAYMPQTEDVDWNFPLLVKDVVATGSYRRSRWGRLSRCTDQDVMAALERVNLADVASRQVGALSGGQRKRVFIARALIQGADLLLLDEPFAGVDQETQHELMDVLRGIRDVGATMLVATHASSDIAELCDEVAVISGTVVIHDRPDVVMRPEVLVNAMHGMTVAGKEHAP